MAAVEIYPGQRWISNTESELGLGLVTRVLNRRIEIHFPAVDEERTYALDNAPLSRIRFNEGDAIQDSTGRSFNVVSSMEHQHCLIYHCEDDTGDGRVIPEQELGSAVHFVKPIQRLFAGQIDRHSYYKLRVRTLEHLHRLNSSPMRGFLGGRIDLLPHQLHVAYQLARAPHPRALLADEVGLGKTIEAGLIIHQRLITGRDRRVLICVPENLQHQWLVEMLRRFNLSFSLMNEDRIEGLLESGLDNPFDAYQWVICSLSLLTHSEQNLAWALASDWDLLVVDEAHHLGWSPEQPSHAYQSVEQLCEQIASVLLLTATPEHLGSEGHFARLRLLDPERFHSLDQYLKERSGYQYLSQRIMEFEEIGEAALRQNAKALDELNAWLGEKTVKNWLDCPPDQAQAQFDRIIELLVATRGPGKMVYRNTRDSVSGFPGRQLHFYPLQADFLDRPDSGASLSELQNPYHLFGPSWISEDPRVAWLERWLAEHRKRKVLLICADAETANELENYLGLRAGVRTAAFHEQMSLVNRDRAAAYFAEPDQGAQLLIASEIGSEGRNFQFASDLILFDLPPNPDLLEQRIGRLDRLGQRNLVQIHLPYLEGTVAEIWMEWLDQGLDAFEQVSKVGDALFREFGPRLAVLFDSPDDDLLDQLITETQARRLELEDQARRGRDRLLELNSLPNERDAERVDLMMEAESADDLKAYAELLFDRFGLEMQPQGTQGWVVKPGEEMIAPLTTLDDEGLTLTFDRQEALHREEIAYMSWEHPLMMELIEWITHSEFGNTSLCTLVLPPLAAGTLLVEVHYRVHLSAPRYWQLDRFLDSPALRLLIDPQGRDLAQALGHEPLNKLARTVSLSAAQKMVRLARNEIERASQTADKKAQLELGRVRDEALKRFDQDLEQRMTKLSVLADQGSETARKERIELEEGAPERRARFEQLSLVPEAMRLILVAE